METEVQQSSDTCPCGEGLGAWGWHKKRGQKICEAGAAVRREYDKDRSANRVRKSEAGIKRVRTTPRKHLKKQPNWTPGTYIAVPEFDPL